MIDELELADRLGQIDCAVGKSRSGHLLRIDHRPSTHALPADLVELILQCVSLRELYLPNLTGMLNQRIDAMVGLKKLKVLDLEGSDFDDDSLRVLSRHANLQVLNVRNTRVTAECVTLVRKIMIGARIIH
jgi:hypothetical protein